MGAPLHPVPEVVGPRRPRALGLALASLASFLAMAALVRGRLRLPEDMSLRAKVEHYEAHADEYDVVFLGSSRIFRSVVPAILDAQLERRGHAWKSFNLGVGGMESFETDAILRRVLAVAPERLQLVVVEVGDWDPAPTDVDRALSERWTVWHTPAATRNALEAVLASRAPWEDKAPLLVEHGRQHLRWLASYGRLAGRLHPRPLERSLEARTLDEEALAAGRGYQSMEELRPEAQGAPPIDERGFAGRVARLKARRRRPQGLASFPLGAIERQLAAARASGVRLVHLDLPFSEGSNQAAELLARGHLEDLFTFNDPEAWPALFDPETRWDGVHPNREGAVRLTRRLAEELARRLDAWQSARRGSRRPRRRRSPPRRSTRPR